MSDYIKKIKTADGEKQIDYTALANLPNQYTGTGQNEDGWMTQKAVTDCLAAAVEETKAYTDSTVSGIVTATVE